MNFGQAKLQWEQFAIVIAVVVVTSMSFFGVLNSALSKDNEMLDEFRKNYR